MKPKKKPVLESAIEAYLVERVEALGGIAEKTVSLSRRGFFDRTCVLPGGVVVFAEVKKPRGAVVSAHQRALHIAYQRLGATVAVINNRNDVDELLKDL